MSYLWYELSEEDQLKMDGKKVWRYLTIGRFIKPQEGVMRLKDGEWRFYKAGERERKGMVVSLDSQFADTKAEAEADYNKGVEKIALVYDQAVVDAEKELLPITRPITNTTVYTYENAKSGCLNGRILYHFRYVNAKRPGSRPLRIRPVKVQVRAECKLTAVMNYNYTVVYTDHIGKYGEICDKKYYAEFMDYFAETEEGAILKYNELVQKGADTYRKRAESIRKEKIGVTF